MKTSPCKTLNDRIVNTLKSGSLSESYSFDNQVLNFIKTNCEGTNKKWGYCSPSELIKLLYESEGRKIPLYGYNGNIDSLHLETKNLLKLGFVDIIDGCYLRLNPDLGVNLDRIQVKENYRLSLLAYNRMKSEL